MTTIQNWTAGRAGPSMTIKGTIDGKRAATVREEARQLALSAARERLSCGDPEGAGALRDLAKDIGRIAMYGQRK